VAHSSYQVLIGQPLAGRAVNEAVYPLRSMPLDIAFIETEGELIDITVHVLRADMVESAINAALENGKETLDPVRCHVATNELGSPMIDRLVGKPGEATIGCEFIGMDCRAGFNVLPDFIVDHVAVCCFDRCSTSPPVPFAHSKNGSFADRAASSAQFLVCVFVGFLPADISLVDFNDAPQLVDLIAASLAKPTKNEPCGFLGDADLFRQLHGRDALARSDDEVHRVNPLVQRNMRALEDRAGADGEIGLALVATIEAALARCNALAQTTIGTPNAIRPKPALQIDAGGLLIREHLEKLVNRDGGLAHGPNPSFWADYSESPRGSQVYKSPILGHRGGGNVGHRDGHWPTLAQNVRH